MTDRHNREVEVVDGMDCDRGGNRRLLPLLVRLANKDSGNNKTKTDKSKPKNLCFPGLEGNNLAEYILGLTLEEEM